MTRKTGHLKVVSTKLEPGNKPPRPLGKAGKALWDRVTGEYDVSDAGGVEMLWQACTAADRAQELSDIIARDGAVVQARGVSREHPALRAELAARSFIVRTISRLGLNFEPLRSGVGRPGVW